jgi:inhibitor of cysteine peptidase
MPSYEGSSIEHCLCFISCAVWTLFGVISKILPAFTEVMQLYGGIAMKSGIFLIFTIFATALSLSSCIVTSHDFNVEVSCDEFGESNHRSGEFEVEVDDKIRVELCSDPTTGFQWDYEMTVENVLKEEDHDFEEPEGDVPGAAGIEVWTFEAVEAGTTVVQMEYRQPSEGGLKSEWTYPVTVTAE